MIAVRSTNIVILNSIEILIRHVFNTNLVSSILRCCIFQVHINHVPQRIIKQKFELESVLDDYVLKMPIMARLPIVSIQGVVSPSSFVSVYQYRLLAKGVLFTSSKSRMSVFFLRVL